MMRRSTLAIVVMVLGAVALSGCSRPVPNTVGAPTPTTQSASAYYAATVDQVALEIPGLEDQIASAIPSLTAEIAVYNTQVNWLNTAVRAAMFNSCPGAGSWVQYADRNAGGGCGLYSASPQSCTNGGVTP